jgi:hypothetical protein
VASGRRNLAANMIQVMRYVGMRAYQTPPNMRYNGSEERSCLRKPYIEARRLVPDEQGVDRQ